MENKCRGCKKRFVGCHAQCPDYEMWKEWHNDHKNLINKKVQKEKDYFYRNNRNKHL